MSLRGLDRWIEDGGFREDYDNRAGNSYVSTATRPESHSYVCAAGDVCTHDRHWIVVEQWLEDGQERVRPLETGIVMSLDDSLRSIYRHIDCPDPRLR